ncbi:Vacuolar protein sorting-associated protein vts1 [Pleurostoma richardsiae]|uniref:Vacuolar protein sorting-associated protein vts1 n=1 Tax=Pleurostoma richardsiae TaxID=41990 RepID=A0AA38R3Q1_9PEZI|nr:Vacuolar protein sorting-associated protein vts1 [Pleurostoma richardsiae]
MADEVPAALKQADVSLYKTATRGAQLQNIKPIMAYWCEYWVVNQILAKGLHNTDPAILEYTTMLMDKLEQTKGDYANDPAVADDAAAQAYVEQFAQDTLDRAERVIKANKVTATTATTFDAALTFFNLVNIWGPPDPETQQKIKYAKWNAARIIKAIKEGQDPNESNPKREEAQSPVEPSLDPNDPEVRMLGGSPLGQGAKPASVEDAPDVERETRPAVVPLPQSPASSVRRSSIPDDGELKLPSAPGYESQPTTSPGYFDPPRAVSPPSHNPATYHPADDSSVSRDAAPSPPPSMSVFSPSAPTGSDIYQAPPAAPTIPPAFASTPPPTAAVAPPSVSPANNPGFTSIPTTVGISRPAVPSSAATGTISSSGVASRAHQEAGTFTMDDVAIAQAQKHAKWAISALNFEDVPTAVRELRRALETLGAS